MAMLPDEREARFGEITDALALHQAIEQARATVSHFSSVFSAQKFKSAPHLLKVPFVRSGPQGEVCVWSAEVASKYPSPELHLWLRVHDALDDVFFAHEVEAPKHFGLAAGDTYVVTADHIDDWMINVDGLVYGAYTLRLQRDELPELAKAAFDNYVGVRQFSTELP